MIIYHSADFLLVCYTQHLATYKQRRKKIKPQPNQATVFHYIVMLFF